MTWTVELVNGTRTEVPAGAGITNYNISTPQMTLTIVTFNPLVNDMIKKLDCALRVTTSSEAPFSSGNTVQSRTGDREIGILQG